MPLWPWVELVQVRHICVLFRNAVWRDPEGNGKTAIGSRNCASP